MIPGESPRQAKAFFDYLVDAHGGAVLRYFSSAPGLGPMQAAGGMGRGLWATSWTVIWAAQTATCQPRALRVHGSALFPTTPHSWKFLLPGLILLAVERIVRPAIAVSTVNARHYGSIRRYS